MNMHGGRYYTSSATYSGRGQEVEMWGMKMSPAEQAFYIQAVLAAGLSVLALCIFIIYKVYKRVNAS